MCWRVDLQTLPYYPYGRYFERKAIVRATLLKLIHFKIYFSNFDKISAVGFLGNANKNILRIFFISSNLGELAAIVYVFCIFLIGQA